MMQFIQKKLSTEYRFQSCMYFRSIHQRIALIVLPSVKRSFNYNMAPHKKKTTTAYSYLPLNPSFNAHTRPFSEAQYLVPLLTAYLCFTAKLLARLRQCASSPNLLLFVYVIPVLFPMTRISEN